MLAFRRLHRTSFPLFTSRCLVFNRFGSEQKAIPSSVLGPRGKRQTQTIIHPLEEEEGSRSYKTSLLQSESSVDENKSTRKESNADKEAIKNLKLLLKGSKATRRQYIMDRSVADTLVTHLKTDLGQKDIIVESSPGLGVLTRALLTETSNTVLAYEPHANLRTELQESLLPQHSSFLKIHSLDFEKFYGYYLVDKKEPEKSVLYNFLSPMSVKVDGRNVPVRVVGVVYDLNFIGRLVLCFAFQCCLFEEIFPILYMYIPFNIYNKITPGSDNIYIGIGLQFQYYFNMETLSVTGKERFYPVSTKGKRNQAEGNNFYLVKISPKMDFFQKVARGELENFHYFMNTVSRIRRAESLIMGLERWIPDCGPHLIKNGLQVFSHPRELTPEQLFLAYKIFISLPSYEESVFHYQRQQFVARFGEKDEAILVNKSAEEIVDMDDHELLDT